MKIRPCIKNRLRNFIFRGGLFLNSTMVFSKEIKDLVISERRNNKKVKRNIKY